MRFFKPKGLFNDRAALFSFGLLLILWLKIFETAWVTEDAYIIFRTIDNFINGYGLRWNIDERVQSFTSPLWLLVNIVPYYLTREVLLTTIFISLLINAATLFIATKPFVKKPEVIFFGFFITLFLSRAFLEFSTSGLEYPLISLLTASFVLSTAGYYKSKNYLIILLFSLLSITRLDAIFILLPLFLYFIWIKKPSLKDYLFGFTPSILWHSFSLFYYGFLFPNTKYAKVNTGIENSALVSQGLTYAENFILNNPLSFAVVILLVGISLIKIVPKLLKAKSLDKKSSVVLLIALGIIINIIYIVNVGGDFMTGRFFAQMIFTSSLGLLIYFDIVWQRKFAVSIVFIALICSILSVSTNSYTQEGMVLPNGIADERGFYKHSNALTSYVQNNFRLTHRFYEDGVKQNIKATLHNTKKNNNNLWVDVTGVIGMRGYLMPGILIIDYNALSDPLLARLNIRGDGWRIGHFGRAIPDGYIHFRSTGDMSEMHPNLQQYYASLRFIISGPLFSWERIKTIVKFNLGYYNQHLKDFYKNSNFQYIGRDKR